MKKQNGFTLIEIMISLLLGLIVLGATISIYVNTVGSSSNTIKSARLNHDLESVMALMINDIKRTGYWGGAIVGADTRNNPFTITTATTTTTNFAPSNIAVMDFTDSGDTLHTDGCILYSYDADGDKHYDGYDSNADGDYTDSGEVAPNGNLNDDTDDKNEFYGFRFNNGSIQMRKTGTTTADCTNGTWEEFIDGNQLTITALTFSFAAVAAAAPFPDLAATSRCLNVATNLATPRTTPTVVSIDTTNDTWCSPSPGSGDSFAQKRVVNIQLSGKLKNDPTVIKTLTGTVQVRNSRLLTQP